MVIAMDEVICEMRLSVVTNVVMNGYGHTLFGS